MYGCVFNCVILLIGFVTTEDNATSILIFVTLKPLDFGVGRKHSSTTQSRIGFGNVKVCLEILRFDQRYYSLIKDIKNDTFFS